MKIKFTNAWRCNVVKDFGYISIFSILYQFDEYRKGITLTILNFQVQIDKGE